MNKKTLKYHKTRASGMSNEYLLEDLIEHAGNCRILSQMREMSPKHNRELLKQEEDAQSCVDIYADEILERLERRTVKV